jgi:D-aminoacyl-tRNA deacylase
MRLIAFSSKVIASMNIAQHMVGKFNEAAPNEWKRGEIVLFDTNTESILDSPTAAENAYPGAEFMVILSSHKSAAGSKSFTVHPPGNWDAADMGGNARTLNYTHSGVMLQILKGMQKANDLGWNVSYEVDHHGPSISTPVAFAEIGSGENEWKDERAGEIVAKAVLGACMVDYSGIKTCFGAGGGHYAPKFTKMALEEGVAFGHMLPKYKADSIGMDTFSQALEKNALPIERAIIEKDGLNSKQRLKIRELCAEKGVESGEA